MMYISATTQPRCGCRSSALGKPPVERKKITNEDVLVTSTAATKAIARRVKEAVVNLWEAFKAEVRASYVANFRGVRGRFDRANVSLRLEKAIEHARQHAETQGWTTRPGWDAKFLQDIWSWQPSGNRDNHK